MHGNDQHINTHAVNSKTIEGGVLWLPTYPFNHHNHHMAVLMGKFKGNIPHFQHIGMCTSELTVERLIRQ